MLKYPTYKPFGKTAILIEWQAIIDEETLDDIVLFKEKIKKEKAILIIDFVIGYNSLTIKYNVKQKLCRNHPTELLTSV